jgi:hypothetical protein
VLSYLVSDADRVVDYAGEPWSGVCCVSNSRERCHSEGVFFFGKVGCEGEGSGMIGEAREDPHRENHLHPTLLQHVSRPTQCHGIESRWNRIRESTFEVERRWDVEDVGCRWSNVFGGEYS